jgi:hypothetical protein
MIEINALDVLKERQVNCAFPQFSKTKLSEGEWNDNDIEVWIKNKLKGRFYVQKLPNVGTDGKLRSSTFVGFEDHKELTYFMLACPYLRRK